MFILFSSLFFFIVSFGSWAFWGSFSFGVFSLSLGSFWVLLTVSDNFGFCSSFEFSSFGISFFIFSFSSFCSVFMFSCSNCCFLFFSSFCCSFVFSSLWGSLIFSTFSDSFSFSSYCCSYFSRDFSLWNRDVY